MTLLLDPELAVVAQLETLTEMVLRADRRLSDVLWGDGQFVLVGSEVGEVCRTLPELRRHFDLVFDQAARFRFDFPHPTVEIAGPVAWLLSEGTLTRLEPGIEPVTTPYVVSCIFQLVNGVWRWRQFFGSEPS